MGKLPIEKLTRQIAKLEASANGSVLGVATVDWLYLDTRGRLSKVELVDAIKPADMTVAIRAVPFGKFLPEEHEKWPLEPIGHSQLPGRSWMLAQGELIDAPEPPESLNAIFEARKKLRLIGARDDLLDDLHFVPRVGGHR